MQTVACSWNHDGSIIAACGMVMATEKESNQVSFYSAFGVVSEVKVTLYPLINFTLTPNYPYFSTFAL